MRRRRGRRPLPSPRPFWRPSYDEDVRGLARRRGRGGPRGAGARHRAAHPARRRAGRQLPLGRARQLAGRRARRGGEGRPAAHLLDALRGRRVRRDRAPARGRARTCGSEHHEIVVSRARHRRRLPAGGRPHRAPDPAHRAGAALPALEAGARVGHQGRAHRRGRRRDVRRLRPVPRGEGAPLLGAPARARRCARGCSSGSIRTSRARRSRSRRWRGSSSAGTWRGAAAPGFSHDLRWQTTSALKRLFAAGLRDALAGHDARAELLATLPAEFARWSFLGQDQYLEMRTLLSGYLLAVAGRPHADGALGRGSLPVPRRRRHASSRTRCPTSTSCASSTRSTCSSAIGARAGSRRRSPRARSSPTARRTRCRSSAPTRPAGSTRRMSDARRRARRASSSPARSQALWQKCKARGDEAQFSNADNMAVVGVLSTQLLHQQFIASQPASNGRRAANARRARPGVLTMSRGVPLLHDYLAESAPRLPDKIALVAQGQRLTYARARRARQRARPHAGRAAASRAAIASSSSPTTRSRPSCRSGRCSRPTPSSRSSTR